MKNNRKTIYLNHNSKFFSTKELADDEKSIILDIMEDAKDYELKNRNHSKNKKFEISDYLKMKHKGLNINCVNWIKKIYKDVNVIKFDEKDRALNDKAKKFITNLFRTSLDFSELLEMINAYFVSKSSLERLNANFANNQDDYEIIKNSFLDLPRRLPNYFSRDVLKSLFYEENNDIYLECSYVYDRCVEQSAGLVFIEPDIYIIDKLIKDNNIADKKLIIALSNATLLKILNVESLPTNIEIISIKELMNISNLANYVYNVFAYDTERDFEYVDYLKQLSNVCKDLKFKIFGSDVLLLDIESKLHHWIGKQLSIKECIIFPRGIKDAASPQAKALISCETNASLENILVRRISLNPNNEMSLLINSFSCDYDQSIFKDRNLRTVYSRDYLEYQRKTNQKRIHLEKIYFSKEIVIQPSVSLSNGKYRCECTVKMPSNIDKRYEIGGVDLESKTIEQTNRSENPKTIEEALYFINSKYLFKKKKGTNIPTHVDIKNIFEKIYDSRVISFSTFCLMYFDEIKQKVSKEYLNNLFGLDDNGYLNNSKNSLLKVIGDYDLIEINYDKICYAFERLNLSEEKINRYILYTYIIINLAIDKGYAEKNPFPKSRIRNARNFLSEVKLSFMKRHNSEQEAKKILNTISNEKELLLFELRTYKGIKYEYLYLLSKKDFEVDLETGIMYMKINNQYNNSPVNLIPLNDYLKNKIISFIKNMNDDEKIFEFKNKRMNSVAKINSYMRDKVKTCLDLKPKIETFKSNSGKNIFVDYNDYSRDYFSNGFKFMADKYGFYDAETRFLIFKEQYKVYARHYKDFNNCLVQYVLKKKMERIFNVINSDNHRYSSLRKNYYGKDFELVTRESSTKLSHCEVEIVIPANSNMSIKISNEFGFETKIERID